MVPLVFSTVSIVVITVLSPCILPIKARLQIDLQLRRPIKLFLHTGLGKLKIILRIILQSVTHAVLLPAKF